MLYFDFICNMTKKLTKAIIFDLGGVIINIDYEATIKAFQALGIPDFYTLYSQANQASMFNDLETGRISSDEFIDRLLLYTAKGTSRSDVVDAWNKMVLDVPGERIDFLKGLKPGYKIFLLSNTNSIHMEKVNEEWAKATDIKLSELFDKVYLSHEAGMRKPNANIFQHVLEDQLLDARQTLFIDDSFQHIEGADQLGLKTVHLKKEETITSVLPAKLGLC